VAYGNYVRNPTWADNPAGGTPIDAAHLNNNDAGVFNAFYMPAVRVTHNAAQSITNATETTLAFNTERFDQAGNAADTMHDTVTNNSRLTCRYAGVYQITAQLEWAAAPGAPYIRIRLNGTTIIAMTGAGATADLRYMTISTLYALAVNDYVEVRVFQNSGGAINVTTANHTPEFMMVRVG